MAAKQVNRELEDLFYLTDIVKCWSRGDNDKNRTPHNQEINNCYPFLIQEIRELKPWLIVSFGNKSSRNLLGKEINITETHGTKYNISEFELLTLIHPSPRNLDANLKLAGLTREDYVEQLVSLFGLLKTGETEGIADIFA